MTDYECEECQDLGEITTLIRYPGRSKLITLGCPKCCKHEDIDRGMCIDCGCEIDDDTSIQLVG